MNVPFMDLKLQYAAIKHEILPAIADVWSRRSSYSAER